MPPSRSDEDSRERSATDHNGDADPAPARTIGRFLAGDAPHQEVPRHSRVAELPAPAIELPHRRRRVDESATDVPEPAYVETPEPVYLENPEPVRAERPEPVRADNPEPVHAERPRRLVVEPAVPPRRPVSHAAPEPPGSAARERTGRQSGLVIVLALLAASVAISASLVWGLHLHRSSSSVGVTPLDSTRSAPRFDMPARGADDGSQSSRGSESLDEPEPEDELDRRLNEPDDPSLDDLGTDADPDADKYSSPLSDPDDSIGGTPKDNAGLDQSDGTAPSTGRQTRQQPRGESYPDYSRNPDSSGRQERSRPRLPSLGGL